MGQENKPTLQPISVEPITTPGITESDTTDQTQAFNPLASNEGSTEQTISDQKTVADQSFTSNDNTIQPPVIESQNVDAASVALEPLSDEEINELRRLLRTDPALRLQLAEEFRYNTNPERAKQLAALLGLYNDPEIVQIAIELAYSGDPESQRAGLDLLSRLQPHNDAARDAAINLLSSESDSTMLVATMNVLATPSRTATPEQQQLLADNLDNLSNHQDPKIRAHSIALMGRWDKNSDVSKAALTRGLTDTDPNVRSRATYAINNVQAPDENMINGLLAIAENATEKQTTRYAALDALSKMPLSGTAQRRYNAAKIYVSRRP